MSPSQRHYPLIVVGEAGASVREFRGAERFGFKTAQHQRATDFFLLRGDGTGLRYSVVMVDLAERLEVGVIHVEEIGNSYRPEQEFLLPSELTTALCAQRLVMDTEHGSVDSGLVLTAHDGGEIVIVSGAYPFTVEVMMTPTLPGSRPFEPEYSLDDYERKPVQQVSDPGRLPDWYKDEN